MSAVFFALVFAFLTILGFVAPFVLSLCYVWVDILKPQSIGYDWIRQAPLSFIAGILAVGSYLLLDRGVPSRITTLHVLLATWAVWVTATTCWALLPTAAWVQWDTAIKTILFSAFIPFVFRTRPQIEALVFFLVLVPATAILPAAVKTLVTGGGYGSLPSISNSTTLAEASTLSMVSTISIPLALYAASRSSLITRHQIYKLASYAYVVMCLLVTVGTQARTGLVSIVALGISGLLMLKNRLRFIVFAAAIILAGWSFIPTSWFERMSTITHPYEETSAEGRIEVWTWTMDFAKDHPLGGGFDVYRLNEYGRAFHSIYFQVLGEHGYVGLAIYLLLLLVTITTQLRIYKATKGVAILSDKNELSRCIIICTFIFMCGGAFIGIAYLPIFYYLVALTISMACEVQPQSSSTHSLGVVADITLQKSSHAAPASSIQT